MTDTNRYRSGLERDVARQINRAGREFEFETVKINYLQPAKSAKYTPDFKIMKRDGTPMFIESKGRFLTKDRQKHLLIREQHPELDIRLVFQRANEKIGKGSNTTYAKWATDKGFKWSDKGIIPKEWFDE